MEGTASGGRTIALVSVYSTPSLRVGVYRCPPGDALWHETNDNIGERPHVVFPGTVVGLVRRGHAGVATPNDVVFYRPFETYERSLRDERGDVSLFIAPRRASTCPSAPVGRVDARTFLLARRLARRLRDEPTRCSSRRPRSSSSTVRSGRRCPDPGGARGRAATAPSSPRAPRTCCSRASHSRCR